MISSLTTHGHDTPYGVSKEQSFLILPLSLPFPFYLPPLSSYYALT
jgi:hypothetical protein